MRVHLNAVPHSWTLLAASGGLHAPGGNYMYMYIHLAYTYIGCILELMLKGQEESMYVLGTVFISIYTHPHMHLPLSI